MKQVYLSPDVILLPLAAEDVLTLSGDNDSPFIKVDGNNDGWTGFY